MVSTSSDAHKGRTLDFNDLQFKQNYRGFSAYGSSKLCNILFTRELAKRWSDAGVTVNCLHPGFVASRFGNNNGGVARALFGIAKALFAISETNGARTSVYLASSPDVDGVTGKYFDGRRAVKSSAASYDELKWRELWRASEKLTGLG